MIPTSASTGGRRARAASGRGRPRSPRSRPSPRPRSARSPATAVIAGIVAAHHLAVGGADLAAAREVFALVDRRTRSCARRARAARRPRPAPRRRWRAPGAPAPTKSSVSNRCAAFQPIWPATNTIRPARRRRWRSPWARASPAGCRISQGTCADSGSALIGCAAFAPLPLRRAGSAAACRSRCAAAPVTNSIARGYLYGAIARLTKSCSAFAIAASPRCAAAAARRRP